ncbi:hypothetical protein EXIGLDRAFT_718113 [Exidia glandulosa HHB12029]|uniref:Uncharacterized protein n=1 Tax=Exidia glandulosa HHB12029 TaxID=1314781 RepID=A0A165HZ12_EXIGL|nr:hypothetical protein EXIGLDRAFT_718113 [Exidia glandulosa HHB12029]
MRCSTYNELLAWHQLARTLIRGRGAPNSRPGLPVEIVLFIIRLAELLVPLPSLRCHVQEKITVYAPDGHIAQADWFATNPLSRHDLQHIAALQLRTYSHDQGWANDPDAGSWTWFDVCIATPQKVLAIRPADGTELRWRSHSNPVASKKFKKRVGLVFAPDHEIWTRIRDGQVILVRACAQFGSWTNYADRASLDFWGYFEPVVV